MIYTKLFQTNNKFRAVKQSYAGNIYDSKAESQKAAELDILVRTKQIKGWTRQERFELRGENGSLVAHYKPDFSVFHNDGTTEIIEVKGGKATQTPVWRLKWKLLEDKLKNTPNIKLTIEER